MNLRSQPYGTYRASNNEWVDKSPSGWEEKRVKDLFRLVTDKAPIDNDHELLSLYASIGVRPRKDLEARGNKASSTDGYWLVKKGDIVVNKLLAWMGSVGLSDFDGVTSPAYDVLRKTTKTLDERYFSYLFRTEIAKQIFKKNSRGIMDMRLRLYFDKLGAITVPVPPFSTQQAIAAYIDSKTAQLDRKIDLLSQKAAQYGKLKQSLINETVTRGLDKTVAMKDSGVEWLGEVPAHWEVKRIKDLSSLQSGNTIVSEQIEEAGLYPVYGGNGLRGYFSQYTNKGDYILIGRQGALCGNINYASGKFWASEHAVVVYLNRSVNMKWYGEMLRVMNLNQYSISAAQPGLAVDRIKRLLLPVPPYPEQQAIAAYLDSKTAHIDRIVATINSQIDKLRELRKTLINDIVTGKICIVEQSGAGALARPAAERG